MARQHISSPSGTTEPRGRKLSTATPLILLFVLFHQAYVGVAVRAQYVPPAHLGRAKGTGAGTRFRRMGDSATLHLHNNSVAGTERSVISRNASIIPRDDQSSSSTAMYLVSHDDFCLYGPPDPFQYISDTALDVVSWCSQSGHNTRLIPDGTLHGVTYVKATNWVQVSGTGDFTKINIAPGDSGGQFDSTTNTPSGAQMFVSDDSDTATSWVTMISADTFCVRACTGDAEYCPTDYDEMGCWFFTSNGVGWDDVWQDCQGDDGDPPGVVDGTTYTQGATPVPTFTAPAVSNCQGGSSVSNGQSAPASQTWTGDSGSASASATGSSGGSASASDSGSGAGDGGSTSWVAVQTCIPCTTTAGSGSGASSATSAATSSAAASSSGSGSSGGTEQVGVTQLGGTSTAASGASSASSGAASASATGASENGGVAAVQLSGTGSASTITKAATATTSASTSKSLSSTSGGGNENGGGGSDDLLDKRGWLIRDDSDGGTTTSDGQCCFTTWTASVVGGDATATATGGGSGSAATGSTAASGSGSKSASASTTGSAAKSGSTSASKSSTATATGAAGASSTLKTGNTTTSSNSSGNGTNSSSSAFGLLDIVPLKSGVGPLVGLVLGTVGWVMVASGMLM